MAAPIVRTAWTDDDGSGTTGTVINNAEKTTLYAQIDQALTTDVVQTTTSTGTVHDFALTAAVSLMRCNNASDLVLTGLVAGYDGQQVTIVSIGAGRVFLKHQNAGSVAANRCINYATSGDTPLAAGVGTATVRYDATTARWRLIAHEQGAWITPTFAAGDFTADSGTWTVDAGDLQEHKYLLRGRTLTVAIRVVTSDVSATPTNLRSAIPGGFVSTTVMFDAVYYTDAGGAGTFGRVFVNTSVAYLNYEKISGTWSTTSADNTAVMGQITFEVN